MRNKTIGTTRIAYLANMPVLHIFYYWIYNKNVHLVQDLQELLPLHRERNMARIAAADLQARQLYLTRMQDGVSVAPCLHPHSLESLHRSTSAAALENFRNCWLDLFLPDECEAEFRAVRRPLTIIRCILY